MYKDDYTEFWCEEKRQKTGYIAIFCLILDVIARFHDIASFLINPSIYPRNHLPS